MIVRTSSGRTARQVASKSKSAGWAASSSASETVPGTPVIDADDRAHRRLGVLGRRPDLVEELRLADHDPVAGVAEQMGDLLGRERVVDRERGGAGVQGSGVDEVELDAVGQHDADGVAGADPEPGEATREGSAPACRTAATSPGCGRRPRPARPCAGCGRRSPGRPGTEFRARLRMWSRARMRAGVRRRLRARLKLTTGVVNIDPAQRPHARPPARAPALRLSSCTARCRLGFGAFGVGQLGPSLRRRRRRAGR